MNTYQFTIDIETGLTFDDIDMQTKLREVILSGIKDNRFVLVTNFQVEKKTTTTEIRQDETA